MLNLIHNGSGRISSAVSLTSDARDEVSAVFNMAGKNYSSIESFDSLLVSGDASLLCVLTC